MNECETKSKLDEIPSLILEYRKTHVENIEIQELHDKILEIVKTY